MAGSTSPGRLKLTEGLSGDSYYYPAHSSPHPALAQQLNRTWIDELCHAVGLEKLHLPVLWDIDFIATADENYALCEINVNSVSPPQEGPVDDIAATLAARLNA